MKKKKKKKKEKYVPTKREVRNAGIILIVSFIIVGGICLYGFIKHPFISFTTSPLFALILDLF